MSGHGEQPIIIKKKIIKKGGHHGGSWKLAYADFVTAMMAFFLLLWLLSLMDQNKLQGIANYFKKPMRDLFVENQMHDTNIPKVPTEATMKSELSPIRMDLEVHSIAENHANSEALKTAKTKDSEATNLKVANTPNKKKTKEANFNQENGQKSKEAEVLKKDLTTNMKLDPVVQKYQEHLDFKVVNDGLKITIKALKDKPMFPSGDINFTHRTRDIFKWLSKELNQSPKKITIIGHTDSHAYNNGYGISNWELSADRANATRSFLIKSGLKPDKIIRVQGAADKNLYNKKNGKDPSNRRIEIIILNPDAEKQYLNQ